MTLAQLVVALHIDVWKNTQEESSLSNATYVSLNIILQKIRCKKNVLRKEKLIYVIKLYKNARFLNEYGKHEEIFYAKKNQFTHCCMKC